MNRVRVMVALAATMGLAACSESAEERGRLSVRGDGSGGQGGGIPAGTGGLTASGGSLSTGGITPPGPSSSPLDYCDPGAYVGTYECFLVQQGTTTETKIEGIVAFELEANEVAAGGECQAGDEFCDLDLVIKQGSGELFGFVLGFIGFECGLEGGLDCSTGAFTARAVDGIYGVPWPDENDPEMKLKVTVPIGMFDGTLDGYHGGAEPQIIAGEWNLGEPNFDIYCPGPFSVERER